MSARLLKKLKHGSVALMSSLLLTYCSSPSDEPKPVVEEGVFINEIYASGEDWIELYNNLEASKDIGGYYIYDDAANKYEIPAGTTIASKGFLVLLCNDLATGLNTNFKLTSTGETVYLENSTGTLIDKVKFPTLNGGQSYGRYPDGSSTFAISGNTTQNASNGDTQAPAIASVVRTPLVPALNQSVTIAVTLVSNVNVASVKLFYRFNGGSYSTITMTLASGIYSGNIPGQSSTGLVEYYIEAKGLNGKSTYKPATAPTKVDDYILNTDPLPQLVINEFLAFNSTCCPDNSSGTDEFDDWIEIYNKGAVPVNIANMYLSDNLANPFNSKIPDGNSIATTIPPGGYLILWADNSPIQGPLHLGFALANTGEEIGLYYIDGRTIDTITFGAQSENISYGRTTDGAGTWKVINPPKPGASN